MELREYNLLRQGKYQYEFLPAGSLYMAHIKGEERRAKKQRLGHLLDRAALVAVTLTALYLAGHAAWWVMR